MLVGILGIQLAAEVALGRSGVRAWRRRPKEDVFVSAGGRTFRGGAQFGFVTVTRPFAQLSFDRDGAVIRMWPTGRATITRSNVVDVKCFRFITDIGIRFVGKSGEYDSIVFWTSDSAAVLWELRKWGWPVPE